MFNEKVLTKNYERLIIAWLEDYSIINLKFSYEQYM